MKLNGILLILLIGCVRLDNSEEVRPDQNIDYSKIFSGENWKTSAAFLSWAKPLPMRNSENMKCSERTKKRLADSINRVLFCEELATLEPEGHGEPAQLIWAIIRSTASSPHGHDCNAGMVYLDRTQSIIEDAPAICRYSLNIPDPSDTPIFAFQVTRTGELGIVFDGHGAECGGRAVLKQDGDSFERIHEFYWDCVH